MFFQNKFIWSSEEVSKVIEKKIEISWHSSGLEFNSKNVKKGSVFFALPGTKSDGHNFIKDAINSGAVAVIVHDSYKTKIYNNKLIKVNDVHKALLLLASHARNRVSKKCYIIAITGSSGKTSTKEMIKSGLKTIGTTYTNPGSYNNHVGVPYSLANMPCNTQFGIFSNNLFDMQDHYFIFIF